MSCLVMQDGIPATQVVWHYVKDLVLIEVWRVWWYLGETEKFHLLPTPGVNSVELWGKAPASGDGESPL